MHIASRNAKELHAGYLVTNGVLAPVVMFYDAKPRLVKTPVEGKPSTMSPNHTCQCLLLILSYSICHFSTARYL